MLRYTLRKKIMLCIIIQDKEKISNTTYVIVSHCFHLFFFFFSFLKIVSLYYTKALFFSETDRFTRWTISWLFLTQNPFLDCKDAPWKEFPKSQGMRR